MQSSIARSLPPLASLFAGALLLGCEQPLEPSSSADVEPRFSHQAGGVSTLSGTYVPINGSGVRGSITVTDDGGAITVVGSATGLDPANIGGYVSLFYDKASSVQGPHACEPGRNVGTGTDHPLSLTILQMILDDAWVVDSDGVGSFGPASPLAYVPADMVGTISIRDVRVSGGVGPEAVVACARLTPH